MDNRAEGIDISAIGQGKFNWLPWEGHIDFAIVKATEGTNFTDPQFTRNWAHMTAMGIGKLAYHFGHAEEDPSDQARLFTNILKAHGYQQCAMVLDIEQKPPGQTQIPAGEVAMWSQTFMWECHRLIGPHPVRVAIAYSDDWFIDAGNLAHSGNHPLWIAQPQAAEPAMPVGPFKDWLIWQYAWGARGGPNRDKWNGTVKDLHKYLRG